MDEKVRCVKYRPKGSNWCTELADSFAEMFQSPEIIDTFGDDVYEFQVIEMTRKEFNKLPEFTGF